MLSSMRLSNRSCTTRSNILLITNETDMGLNFSPIGFFPDLYNGTTLAVFETWEEIPLFSVSSPR